MMTATNLRKHLFQALDEALRGEPVEITYKGSRLRLISAESPSKLARAVRRHALLVEPASIVESDAGLMAELEKKWRADDETL